jgi:hypothetical protein
MLYTTTVLTERVEQHKAKIKKIENFDSPQLDIEEAADQIVNHENSIKELEKAILIILKHEE